MNLYRKVISNIPRKINRSIHPDIVGFTALSSISFLSCGYMFASNGSSYGSWNWNWKKTPYHVRNKIETYTPKIIQPHLLNVSESFYSKRKSERCIIGLIAMNTAITALFRVNNPNVQKFLFSHFIDNAYQTRKPYTMITSTFTHISLPHLAANMFALYTFAPPVIEKIGVYHFAAFYITGGAASSTISRFSKRYFRASNSSSVGASGAIFSTFALYAHLYPKNKLTFPFVETDISFSPRTALAGSMMVDTLCLLMKFSHIDHYAHLGGSFFGLFYGVTDGFVWDFFKKMGKKISNLLS